MLSNSSVYLVEDEIQFEGTLEILICYVRKRLENTLQVAIVRTED